MQCNHNYNVSSNKYNVYHNANKTINLRLGKHSYIRRTYMSYCVDHFTSDSVAMGINST